MEPPSARWLYVSAYVDATYHDIGPGTGDRSVFRGMSEAEFGEARTLWDALWQQHQKCSVRNRWLAENQDAPDWQELDARATRSDLKFGRLRNELAEWAGVDVEQVCELLAGPALLAPARGAGEGR